MQEETRTDKAIRNTKYAIAASIISFVANFIARNIFLKELGTDVLGLNTTVQSYLAFLNIAELGISTAIVVTLYKPILNKDYNTINEIVSLQGWLYRRIGTTILVGALILMCFFPLIFKNMELPLWYAYALFITYLLNALLLYFVTYIQHVLSGNQQQYKIILNNNITLSVCIIFQIIAVTIFDNDFEWWVTLQILFILIATFLVYRETKRSHPYLKLQVKLGKTLRNKYPDVLTKTKQIFVHRVAGTTLTQAQPLIISAYASLTTVAYYANYLVIINGLNLIINSVFNGMTASIGNMIAEGNKELIHKIYRELFSFRFFIASILVLTTYYLTPPFITLWIGEEYVMSNTILIIILFSFFLGITKGVTDMYLSAYGLFKDMWAPIAETIINISVSVILGYLYDINGILMGAIISMLVIGYGWKPYFLFKNGLNSSVSMHYKLLLKHILVVSIVLATLIYADIDTIYWNFASNKYLNFVVNGITIVVMFSAMIGLPLYIIEKGFRGSILRIINNQKFITRFTQKRS